MIFYRPHRGGLKEAMDKAVLFNTVNEMIEHIAKEYNSFAIKPIIKDNISLKLYDDSPDTRIGWKRTYIVLINGIPDGFFTDEYEKNWEEEYNRFLQEGK